MKYLRNLVFILAVALLLSVSIFAATEHEDTATVGDLSNHSDVDYYKIVLTDNDIITFQFDYQGEANFSVRFLDAEETQLDRFFRGNHACGNHARRNHNHHRHLLL